jgi:hypothetical protein
MNYDLLFTRELEIEVEHTINYLAKRSPHGAVAGCEQWANVLDELKRSPLQHGFAPESVKYGIEIRQILFKTRRGRKYRALFTIVGRGVYVIQLRGPHQDLLRRDQLRRRR